MNFRMSPRRWFWLILLAALVWSYVGHRAERPDPANPTNNSGMPLAKNPPVLRRIQDAIASPVRVVIVPPEFVFGIIEGAAVSAIERATARRDSTVTVEGLETQVRDLQAQKAQLAGLLADALERAGALNRLPSVGLAAKDVLSANITGHSAGQGADTVHLDKGDMDGVKYGMVVVAPLEQVTVLGAIISVGPKESTLRLLTDQNMKVRGDIVRDSATPITSQACLIEGAGGGQMQCETLNVQQNGNMPPPQRGDFVRLTDAQWPRSTQFMLIGQIDDVSVRENQALRYHLKIIPTRPITSLKSVMIVVKE